MMENHAKLKIGLCAMDKKANSKVDALMSWRTETLGIS